MRGTRNEARERGRKEGRAVGDVDNGDGVNGEWMEQMGRAEFQRRGDGVTKDGRGGGKGETSEKKRREEGKGREKKKKMFKLE